MDTESPVPDAELDPRPLGILSTDLSRTVRPLLERVTAEDAKRVEQTEDVMKT